MTMGLPDAVARELRAERGRPPARRPEQRPGLTRRRSAVALAGVPLFDGFSRRHLSYLAGEADEVSFVAGGSTQLHGLASDMVLPSLSDLPEFGGQRQ